MNEPNAPGPQGRGSSPMVPEQNGTDDWVRRKRRVSTAEQFAANELAELPTKPRPETRKESEAP